MKIHLDTDIGGDIDDLCALALLLKHPDVEITGVTTVSDEQGRRAGYVRYVLNLMGRSDIPCAAGADVSGGYYRYKLEYPPEEENWPEPISPLPGPVDKAIALLNRSIEQGATVVGIGPYTNLMLLEKQYPGILKRTDLFLMGGHIFNAPSGYPQWDTTRDYNIQVEVNSALYVLEHANATLVPITITCQTALRRAYLPALSQAGRLGSLIARQAEVYAKYQQYEQRYGATCPGLPQDILNFQHDPLTCAIAVGWRAGVEIQTVPLRFEVKDSWLYEIPDRNGIPTRVVTRIDGNAFNEYWYHLICQGQEHQPS
jgi:purine nucleosidase